MFGFGKKRKMSEPPKKTDQFDEDDKRTRDIDNSKETQTLQVTESENRNNDEDQILTNSRYLTEDSIREEREETPTDLSITNSKVLRGHHSIQSSLAETKEGELEISSSNSGMTNSLGSSLKIDIHEEPKDQSQNNEHIEREEITGASENM